MNRHMNRRIRHDESLWRFYLMCDAIDFRYSDGNDHLANNDNDGENHGDDENNGVQHLDSSNVSFPSSSLSMDQEEEEEEDDEPPSKKRKIEKVTHISNDRYDGDRDVILAHENDDNDIDGDDDNDEQCYVNMAMRHWIQRSETRRVVYQMWSELNENQSLQMLHDDKMDPCSDEVDDENDNKDENDENIAHKVNMNMRDIVSLHSSHRSQWNELKKYIVERQQRAKEGEEEKSRNFDEKRFLWHDDLKLCMSLVEKTMMEREQRTKLVLRTTTLDDKMGKHESERNACCETNGKRVKVNDGDGELCIFRWMNLKQMIRYYEVVQDNSSTLSSLSSSFLSLPHFIRSPYWIPFGYTIVVNSDSNRSGHSACIGDDSDEIEDEMVKNIFYINCESNDDDDDDEGDERNRGLEHGMFSEYKIAYCCIRRDNKMNKGSVSGLPPPPMTRYQFEDCLITVRSLTEFLFLLNERAKQQLQLQSTVSEKCDVASGGGDITPVNTMHFSQSSQFSDASSSQPMHMNMNGGNSWSQASSMMMNTISSNDLVQFLHERMYLILPSSCGGAYLDSQLYSESQQFL